MFSQISVISTDIHAVSSHFYVIERSFHGAERYITIDVVKVFIDLTALVPNGQHCLQWRTCQTKSDVSAEIIFLKNTALSLQPQAIEAMQSYAA
jgi:aminopeptidase-like protein